MNYEYLRDRYVLLDTNVVINFGRYRAFYQVFIDELLGRNIVPVINHVVRAELYAYARTNEDAMYVDELLRVLGKNDPKKMFLLPLDKDAIDRAIALGRKYQSQHVPVKNIQLADLLIGADMERYKKGGLLVLATENHQIFHSLYIKELVLKP